MNSVCVSYGVVRLSPPDHNAIQERELRAKLKAFFSLESADDVLLLQCDLQASSVRMVEHAKFVVENER